MFGSRNQAKDHGLVPELTSRGVWSEEHCWGGQIRWAPVSSQTRPRENQVWVANGWCKRVSDLLCTIPLHRPTCILQTESQNADAVCTLYGSYRF